MKWTLLLIFLVFALCDNSFAKDPSALNGSSYGSIRIGSSFVSSSIAKDAPVLTDLSYGSIRFGDKLKDVEKKLNTKAKTTSGEFKCDFVTFTKYPVVRFLVENGIITRADVDSPSISNSMGIKIHSRYYKVMRRFVDQSELLLNYPCYESKQYCRNITFTSKDGERAMVFMAGKGEITAFRAGLESSTIFDNPCLSED